MKIAPSNRRTKAPEVTPVMTAFSFDFLVEPATISKTYCMTKVELADCAAMQWPKSYTWDRGT